MREKKQTTKKKGFTIVEMMVSVGIFTMVLSASVGGLLTMVNANNKAQALRVAMDNMNFVMEDMSRHITQGRTYYCDENGDAIPNPDPPAATDPLSPKSCSNGGGRLYFLSNKADVGRVWYQLIDDEIVKRTTDASGVDDLDAALTSKDVLEVTNLTFFVEAGDTGDEQPKVLVTVSGQVVVGSEVTTFNAQTTIVQRIPKI